MTNCIFDGASTMSGAINGVQPRLQKIHPHILYTHCLIMCQICVMLTIQDNF